MNAMARDLPGEAMDETIAHEPASDAVPSGPAGTDDMPNTTPQGQNRYIFGSGARPLEGYTIKRAIGRGGFGEVYYATSDAGKEVALKLITRNLDIERRGVIQCMNLKSPNLITIYDMKTTEVGDTFVIMEYVAGPSLANVLAQHPKGLPMNEVRHWLKGLIEGVAYLHDHGIVHRDLKPANLFMEQGVVKIGDYGLSKLITQSQGRGHSESVGTCHYMAPEISTGQYYKPIDVYAIGIILYEMITGRVPFEGETVGEVLMKHLTARPDLSPLQEPYKSIVAKATAKDPAHRPSRVYDLLGPEDAPKAPPVRFIGDKNPGPDGKVVLVPDNDDDVLRIGVEEPVFYIGPDTRPPVRRGTFRERFWGAVPRGQDCANKVRQKFDYKKNQYPTPAVIPAAQKRPQQVARRVATSPPPVPAALPTLPPLPSSRVRVAEMAGSMLWAAPIAALLSVPASGIMGINAQADPQQLGYLFG
ncbi:MAG TPA: serine/threonine-protein kinase, partial [Isosphaeraceae bacterium]|nr:serine/threonine-protein kinase [Isosphaeraceae bacterium]